MIKAIALLGKYTPIFSPHAYTNAVIMHSQSLLDVKLTAYWISTEDIGLELTHATPEISVPVDSRKMRENL